MPTQQRTVDFVIEQMSAVSGISARKMFGEWGLFVDGKTVGVICNDQLYVKPTDAGRKLAPDALLMPPYRGAKPSLMITAEAWDDADWLATLIQATVDALPAPKPKKPKKKPE